MLPLLIIGAGPSGLFAAATAASRGATVLLLERLPEPGRKLLVTGGGRCNLTHDLSPADFIRAFARNHKPTARFLAPALHHLPPAALRQWFADRRVPTLVQPDRCVFPVSQNARDILVALLHACHESRVQIRTNTRVVALDPAAPSVTLANGETLRGSALILATGGLSYPTLGADPQILSLLANLGLNITPPTPALVGLMAPPPALPPTAPAWSSLAGLTLDNASIAWQSSPSATITGPLLFTHRGLSGPPILETSRDLPLQHPKTLLLSTRADRTAADWQNLFTSWHASRGATKLHNLLSGQIPRPWAEYLCAATHLLDTAAAQASRGNLQFLATALSAFPFSVADTEGWDRAIITRGGLALSELDPHTLQCRRFPKLHGIGEALDLDGPCGGFNLTWAFSSASLCATALTP